jgi:23S rRNA (uracil1939-C5)-methyltransferase
VLAFEGSDALVAGARANAARNGLEANTRFETIDLFRIDEARLRTFGSFDAMLIDPPRDGAVELVKALPEDGPARLVYVSCSPGTLARDASILVHGKGYRLASAGVVNMFPHTAHVESIALFLK